MVEYKPVANVVKELLPDARNSIEEIVRRRPAMMVTELVALFPAIKPVPPLREKVTGRVARRPAEIAATRLANHPANPRPRG